MAHVMERVAATGGLVVTPSGVSGERESAEALTTSQEEQPKAGDVIRYRVRSMTAGDPDRIQTVDRVLDNGNLVLSDGEYLYLQDVLSLRVTLKKLVRSENGELGEEEEEEASGGRGVEDYPDPSSERTTSDIPSPTAVGISEGADAAVPGGIRGTRGDRGDTSPRVAARVTAEDRVCARCGVRYQPTGNRQKFCPEHSQKLSRGRNRERAAKQGRPELTGVQKSALAAGREKALEMKRDDEAKARAARINVVCMWWNLRVSGMGADEAALQLDTPENRSACRAKRLTRDMMRWYRRQYGEAMPPEPPGLMSVSRRLANQNRYAKTGKEKGPAKAGTTNVGKAPAEAGTTNGLVVTPARVSGGGESAEALTTSQEGIGRDALDMLVGSTPTAAWPPAVATVTDTPACSMRRVAERLVAHAMRLERAARQVETAEQALSILDAYPVDEED